MKRRAIILAGGKGIRLRPYTSVLPKPLMPIGDYSILELIIRQLISAGFSHITITVNHMADVIKALIGDGTKWDIHIDYSLETEPLSTMAPLRLINDLPENFLVMNGDVLTDLDYSSLYKTHTKQGNVFTISAYEREEVSEFGVLEPGPDGRLGGFKEKPVHRYLVSMGVYMLSHEVLDYIPLKGAFGFDQLMLKLIDAGNPASIKSFDGYWLDIGRPDDYLEAVSMIEKNPRRFIRNS